MLRTRLALTGLVCAAMITPAAAQYNKKKKPDRREITAKSPFRADAWGPHQGRPGTRVWVTGAGFKHNMTVLIGGRKIALAKYAPQRIEFDVPRAGYGNGQIVLRRGGRSDIVVGRFQVMPDPAIGRFGPSSGAPGTRVEIRGVGFAAGTQVMMNGRALRADSIDPRRIVFRVPAWAKSDYITLAGEGYKVRTRRPFRVLSPAPIIRSVRPAAGAPGTVVRIAGDHFDGREQVFYGRRQLRQVRHGSGWVEFTLPGWARQPQPLRVRNQYGESTWNQRFGLQLPPIVRGFAPRYGGPGTAVTIRGARFASGDRVSLGGVKLPIVSLRPDRIAVTIARRARSGRLVVHRGDLSVATRDSFDVLRAPVIKSWSPQVGRPGTVVTLRGDGFDRGDAVFYGDRRVTPRRGGPGFVEVAVPAGAGAQRWRIVSRGGDVWTGKPFALQVYPTVRGVSPRFGYPGSELRVRGQFLAQAQTWYLGKTPLPVVRRTPREVVLKVPPGAGSGEIWWDAHGQRLGGDHAFEVRNAPIISAFDPAYGPAGSLVTIRGRHLGGRGARVTWGPRQRLRVVKAGRGFVTVKLPDRVRGDAYLWLEHGGQKAQSPQKFRIAAPAVVRRIDPGKVWSGQTLVVHGEGFGPKIRVRVGGQWWPINRVGSGGKRIWVTVPRNARRGAHWVEAVKSGGYAARSPERLRVVAPPRGNVVDKRKRKY
jgi:hypothetical protein